MPHSSEENHTLFLPFFFHHFRYDNISDSLYPDCKPGKNNLFFIKRAHFMTAVLVSQANPSLLTFFVVLENW